MLVAVLHTFPHTLPSNGSHAPHQGSINANVNPLGSSLRLLAPCFPGLPPLVRQGLARCVCVSSGGWFLMFNLLETFRSIGSMVKFHTILLAVKAQPTTATCRGAAAAKISPLSLQCRGSPGATGDGRKGANAKLRPT